MDAHLSKLTHCSACGYRIYVSPKHGGPKGHGSRGCPRHGKGPDTIGAVKRHG